MLLVLSTVLHLAVGARLAPHLDRLPALLLAALLLVSAIAVPLGLLARRIARPPWADRLARIGLPFLGLFSSLFVATLLRELVLVAAWLVDLAAPGQLPPAGVEGATAAAVPVLALAATLVGFANAHRTPRIRTVEIVRDGLPPALDGFTIAQISDLHVAPTIRRRFVQRVVDAVNALQPDLVAVTGDLVDGTVSELAAEVAPLAGLAPRLGSFFVSGNHEYYAGVHPWLAQVRRLGLRVLQNEHVVLERGGATLVLAGVTDYNAGYFERSHRSDPEAALRGAPRDAALKILLAHQPRSAFAAAAAGYDLQLSGHTHGGQFLPWTFFVRLQQPFTAGLHRIGQLIVYVSRGTGYWGPPKRFGAPSEITCIRLVSRATADSRSQLDRRAGSA
jgi:predicted MPP superfamily phosphohydrolase